MQRSVFTSQRRWLNLYGERLEILKNWKEHVENIAKAARSLFKECEVYAFGSVVHGTPTAASDVDVLIIVESLPKGLMERAELKGQIERMANLHITQFRYTWQQ